MEYFYLHTVKFVIVVQSGYCENGLSHDVFVSLLTKYIKQCLGGNVFLMMLLQLLQLLPQMVHISVDV